MAKYIKQHSNYIKEVVRQNTSDGKILESDWTTVGGINNFSPSQPVIYKSNNFLISVSDSETKSYDTIQEKWTKSADGNDEWDYNDVKNEETVDNDNAIKLNDNIYDLRNFAYYGSCQELIRSSINNILNKFPGEMYVTNRNIVYYNESTSAYTALGGDNLMYISNPFNINIHDQYINLFNTKDSLKYFANEGYKEYEIYSGTSNSAIPISCVIVQNAEMMHLYYDNFISGKTDMYYDWFGTNGTHDYYDKNLNIITDSENTLNDKILSGSQTYYDPKEVIREYSVIAKITLCLGVGAVCTSGIVSPMIHLYYYGEDGVENSKIDFYYDYIKTYKYYKSDKVTILADNIDKLNEIINYKKIYYDVENDPSLINNTDAIRLYTQDDTSKTEFFYDKSTLTYYKDKDKTDKISSNINELNNLFIKSSSAYYDSLVNNDVTCHNGISFDIYLYAGKDCSTFYYLTDKRFSDFHIRPKNKLEYDDNGSLVDRRYYNNYINSLDSFEQILLNPSTDPKYSCKFNILYEDDYGVNNYTQTFIFPTDEGDYNIGNTTSFKDYVNQFNNIAIFYDEYFSDNIYRMLTHETIKNFDWAYSRNKSDYDEYDYQSGTTKISNILRVYGREFDEIKRYVNSIKIGNNISYDKVNNVSDYLLTDLLELDGWDIKNIYPYYVKNNEYYQNTDFNEIIYPYEKIYPLGFSDFIHLNNSNDFYYNINDVNYYDSSKNKLSTNVDSINSSIIVNEETFYNIISDGTSATTNNPSVSGSIPYFSNKKYTLDEINNHFLRMLKLNSRNILRHKGTIYGIEMILSLFGFKSKRWVDKYNELHSQTDIYSGFTNESYDYEIKEYTTFMYPILDKYNENKDMGYYDYYNSAKLISYGNLYQSYDGLPVKAINGTNIDNDYIHLYPYFNKEANHDGNLYYQMNGGWMTISPFDFDNNDTIIKATNNNLYTETIRQILSVNTIEDLFNIPSDNLLDNQIVYVSTISNKYVIIDSKVYDIKYDINSNGVSIRYLEFDVYQNSVEIGDEIFYHTITVSDYNGNINVISLDEIQDNYQIRAYIYTNNGNDTIYIYSDNTSISTVNFYDEYMSDTHYYKLMSVDGHTEISDYGWKPLLSTDLDYINMNRIINYYKGNNPHNGNMKYDNGYEYMSYFYELFKYPYENSLFDESIFDNNYYTMNNIIPNIGFKNLYLTNDECNILYPEIEDNKIHTFCGRIYSDSSNNSGKTYNTYITNDATYSLYANNCKLNGDDKTWVNTYIIPNDYDKTTYSVVNTKRIDINFKSGLFDNEDYTENAKYLLSIINNYLKQMVSPNAICKFNFNA